MFVGNSVDIRCWQDVLSYICWNEPFKSKARAAENIHKISALVCQAVRNVAPDISDAELIGNIQGVIARAVKMDGSLPLDQLLHSEVTEAETGVISVKDAVKDAVKVSPKAFAVVNRVKDVKHKLSNFLYGVCTGNIRTLTIASDALNNTVNEAVEVKPSDIDTTIVKATVKANVKDVMKEPVKAEEPLKPTKDPAPKPESLVSKLKSYLTMHYAFRYNVMTRESEMKSLDAAEAQYVVMGKREENTLVIEAQNEGINCWDADVKRFINSAHSAEYHPFIEYFDNLPQWDGVDRVTELAQRVSSQKLWVDSFHRWMLALAAQWMNYRTDSSRANCVAPLLISTEQGWGKSTFCRILMPAPLRRYYTESFDLASPASCEAKLADFGLINLDEFDKITAKKMPTLKNLMQEQALNVKRAYQKGATPLHRIASFIGTSNSRDLLTDRSGSRRFICVELEKEIDCETPIDYAQLYAQLKEELTVQHERTYFTKDEEREIQEYNRTYYHTSVEEELFYRHFRFVNRTDEGARFMSASDIYKHLKAEEGTLLRGVTPAGFARLMSSLGQRVHTRLGNGYYVAPSR